MIHQAANPDAAKGWFFVPWNSLLPIPVGYANEGIQERHYHAEMYEVYLVARGESTAVVNDAEVHLKPGDALVVQPGEVHTFTSSSDDYLHFVIQAPFIPGDKEVLPSSQRGSAGSA